MTRRRQLICALMLMAATLGYAQRNRIELGGQWQFGLDRQKTLTVSSALEDHILLPGSMPERLKGDRPSVKTVWTGSLYDSSFFYNPYMAKYRTEDNLKLPFFLTPDRHYVGRAWYRTECDVPFDTKKERVMLFLERPHIVTTLYVNGKEVGTQNSLSAPHVFDVTDFVKKGEKAVITLCIDNNERLVGVGQDSHSVTDQTQGNWNGIVGRMYLEAMPNQHIEHVDVYPDATTRQLTIVVRTKNAKHTTLCARVGELCVAKPRMGDSDTLHLQLTKDYQLWDEFHPNLYQLEVDMLGRKDTIDREMLTFGVRTITTRGKDIVVNGRVTFLRGTVENCDFPLTGYPPTDKASWMHVFRQCKSYGLNHMRFHSFCPPEAAFEAADEVGFYLQPEGPSWPNHGVKLGNGMMIDDYLMLETQRMVEAYGNHPSFTMLSAGNEPAGNWVAWVSRFVDYWKQTDPRRIYTGASVGGGWAWQPRNQYHVKAGARGLEWSRREPSSMDDFRGKIDTVSQPFVSHETGQWCAFPDLDETTQYTGVYKAKNFEIFRDLLRDNGMASRAKQFLHASGKLQVLCYKHEMERILRTPHYAGFQLLGLNDYSGQGTALVGPLNVFWREKGYVSPGQWTEFCSPVTVLARLPRFTYWSGDTLKCQFELANFAADSLRIVQFNVRLFDDAGTEILCRDLPFSAPFGIGNCQELGNVRQELKSDSARHLTLTASLDGYAGNTPVMTTNHWDVWVYPHHKAEELQPTTVKVKKQQKPVVYICQGQLDDKAIATLHEGGKVLVIGGGKVTYGQGIVQQFTPVFWNTSWFKMKPPHTTGMYIDCKHPLFRNFPTTDFSDLQWWALMNRQQVMFLDKFDADFQPIVQPIDTWFLSRKLGMLLEANVAGGRLMMTTMPLDSDSKYPAVQQMRYAILQYMQSEDFKPSQEVSLDVIQQLFTEKTPSVNMHTKDSPDELKKGVK